MVIAASRGRTGSMMKNSLLLVAMLAACGGGSKSTTPPIAPTTDMQQQEVVAAPTPAPEPAPVPEPAPPPPAPKQFSAAVELAPIKGQKMKAVTVKFSQVEGKSTTAVTDVAIEGLKPGRYHLVVHESADCGPNGTKAGKVWETAATIDIMVEVNKDAPAKVESSDLGIALDGDTTIVGKTFALHDDKAGKPGKIQACGTIAKSEAGAPAGDASGAK
jgi:Cu/Zn superoxide dismutase